MNYTDADKQTIIDALVFKRSQLSKNIEEIDAILARLANPSVINNNSQETPVKRKRSKNTKDWYYSMVKEVLLFEDECKTSREILSKLYELRPDVLNREEDKRHIAAISAALYDKAKAGELQLIKQEGAQAKFLLVIRDEGQFQQAENNEYIEAVRRSTLRSIEEEFKL